MPMLRRASFAGLKVETTAGTDVVPTAGSNAVVLYDAEIHPLSESTSVDREPYSGNLSQESPVPGMMAGTFTCKTYVSGSGTAPASAATAPPWGVALIGCGFKQTVTASTSVTYAPVSTYSTAGSWSPTATYAGMEPLSIYVWNNDTTGAAAGKLYKLLGAMGNAKFSFKTGEPATIAMDFKGVYSAPTVVSFPAPTFTAHQQPKPILAAGCTFTPSGGAAHTMVFRSLEIDMGMEVILRSDGNNASGFTSALIVNRKPTAKLQVEEPASYTPAAGQNWWTNFSSGVVGDLEIGTIGSTAGNIYAIDMPKVGFKKVDMSTADGIRVIDIDMQLATNAISTGDDEFTLTFT